MAARDEGKSGNLRDAKFREAFPEGLMIGSTKKDGKAHTFMTGKDLAQFLPSEGPCGVMTSSNLKGAKEAGALAGQLAAAKLNVAFNDLGLFPDKMVKGKKGMLLSEMLFRDKVHKKLIGVSVSRVIKLTDRALSGSLGAPKNENQALVDVDQDGTPDVSLEDLRQALHTLNFNFRADSNIVGCLKRPDDTDSDGPVAEVPGPKKPGIPGVKKPGAPVVKDPGTPEVQKPGTPVLKDPGTPGAKKVESGGLATGTIKGVDQKSVEEKARIRAEKGKALEKARADFDAALVKATEEAKAKGLSDIPAETRTKMNDDYRKLLEEINLEYQAGEVEKPEGAEKPKEGEQPKKIVKPDSTTTSKPLEKKGG
ncbi:MAG: hypothetical protein V2A76_11705, partial [Planctomycetota bacterium]